MKNRYGKAIAGLVAIGMVCGARAAWAQETRQDRGKRVVEEAVKALGGDAFLGMQDRTETGRIYSFDTGNGKLGGGEFVTMYTQYVPPEAGKFSVRIKQIFGKNLDEGSFLFTPDGGWDISFRGARPLDQATFGSYQDTGRRGIFYILRQRLKEPEMSFYSQGGDIFEHVPVEIVDITDAANSTVTVYFDRNTHLPLRQTFRRRNTQFNDFDIEMTSFAKYREVKGVTLPLDTHRERNGRTVFEMFVETEDVNTGVRESTFTVPANLKVLPKAK